MDCVLVLLSTLALGTTTVSAENVPSQVLWPQQDEQTPELGGPGPGHASLQQLQRQLADQDHLLQEVQSLLQTQAVMLSQQGDRIRQQAATQTQHETLLQQQAAKLAQQERLLDHQAATVVRQEGSLSEQRQMLIRQGELLDKLQSQRKLYADADRDFHTQHGNATTEKNSSPKAMLPSGGMARRADDLPPLQAVVDNMSQQMTQLQAEMQAMQMSMQQVTAMGQGSTFVHWGSSTCPASSQLVYSGILGGSHQLHPGAATNYLCLTKSPLFSNQTTPMAVAYLYGGEYETGDSHQDKDPECAVCRSSLATTIMHPGTTACPSDWHLLYSGFLMAGYYMQAAGSEYICVDSVMESRVGGDVNSNGMLLYYTRTQCGSLPCEPYVNNKVVTCSVCAR